MKQKTTSFRNKKEASERNISKSYKCLTHFSSRKHEPSKNNDDNYEAIVTNDKNNWSASKNKIAHYFSEKTSKFKSISITSMRHTFFFQLPYSFYAFYYLP